MHPVLAIVAGFAITVATLVDIFTTILVPGPSTGALRVSARLGRVSLRLARLFAKLGGGGRRPSNIFAPLNFLLAFGAWMLLLLAGFGLMFFAVSHRFTPALDGLGDAFYLAGSSLITLGVSEVDAHGVGRWLILAAGLSGFAVISATITFVLQIQSALHQRESRVLALSALAGTPPSGLVLLEAASDLGVGTEIHDFFRTWRDWAAAVLHSHLSTPVLIFFHSVDRESEWLSALEAVLDAATLLMALTTHEARGAATLMHRTGSRTAARLAALMEVGVEEPPLDHATVAMLATKLGERGYPVVQVDAAVVATLNDLRADYVGRIAGLAGLLGTERTRPLS